MKKSVLITGILLMLISAGNMDLNAQKGIRAGNDTARIVRHDRELHLRQMRERDHKRESTSHTGREFAGPDRMRIENIQNLTEKQKTEIATMRQQQREEMKKFRDETFSKMQTMRENHRNKILDLLTDEQRKLLEPVKMDTDKTTPLGK
jgi:acyl transferase domain-containing protein